MRTEALQIGRLYDGFDDVESLAKPDLRSAVQDLSIALFVAAFAGIRAPDVRLVVDEAHLLLGNALPDVAVQGCDVAEAEDGVSGVDRTAEIVGVQKVVLMQRRRRKILAHHEVEEKAVVLRRVHVDRDQHAAPDLTGLEDPREVANDADEQIESLALDLFRRGGVEEGH